MRATFNVEPSGTLSVSHVFFPIIPVPTTSQHQHTMSIPIRTREGPDVEGSCINLSAPQCCHCGYRGSHSPNCPFASGRR
ncbi:hypothetical protein BJV78DRAFT_1129608 [Lactifluus subvellereus]|nr:hypothetical protein BJV78DRAFT_1129608 [Lactifluus subvellereus]